jgi:hypothetical protein
MTQLTTLNLGGTLRASAGLALWVDDCNRRRCGWMMMCVVGRGRCVRRCSGWWGLRVAGRGAAARADNQIDADGAASLAPSLGRMAQLTTLNLGGTLCAIGGSWGCSRVLANAGNVLMMLCNVGWGGCALGCSGWWGLRGASRGAAGRWCVQTIRLEQMGQRRWHRVS